MKRPFLKLLNPVVGSLHLNMCLFNCCCLIYMYSQLLLTDIKYILIELKHARFKV